MGIILQRQTFHMSASAFNRLVYKHIVDNVWKRKHNLQNKLVLTDYLGEFSLLIVKYNVKEII